MALVLTADEIVSVRLQLGAYVTVDELSSEQITDENMLGAATDYVFERVREFLDIDTLTEAERLITERVRDDTAENIDNFITVVLKPPQRKQFRRAVVFQTAGLCAPAVRRVESANFSGISQRSLQLTTDALQNRLFANAESEIYRLRNAFPDDAFLSDRERVSKGHAKIPNAFSIVRGD